MFLGFNKNLNYKKTNFLCEEFVKQGQQTGNIFADILYLLSKVGVPKTEKDLIKIIDFIHSIVKRNESVNTRKFERTAKEIWTSKRAEGCSDYTLVFESITRQLRIPTIHLQMINKDWQKTGKNKIIEGHHACECFIENKWVYVDPTCKEIINNYNPNKTTIFSSNNATDYEIFSKSTDIFETGIKNVHTNNETILKICKLNKAIKNRI